MKKVIVLLGVLSSFVLFTGCANNKSVDQPMAAPVAETSHPDYKGETGK